MWDRHAIATLLRQTAPDPEAVVSLRNASKDSRLAYADPDALNDAESLEYPADRISADDRLFFPGFKPLD